MRFRSARLPTDGSAGRDPLGVTEGRSAVRRRGSLQWRLPLGWMGLVVVSATLVLTALDLVHEAKLVAAIGLLLILALYVLAVESDTKEAGRRGD